MVGSSADLGVFRRVCVCEAWLLCDAHWVRCASTTAIAREKTRARVVSEMLCCVVVLCGGMARQQ
eukprot:15301741-Alexandrium_andersonii.AAC.1